MKTSVAALLLALAAVSATAAKQPELPVQDDETLQQSYPAAASFAIDNAWGSIHVTAADTRRIEVTIHKRIRAASELALSQAKRDVAVDVTSDANAVALYVNGPFRKGTRNAGYIVVMNFDIVVPRQIALTLKTLNEGDISVRDVSGDFTIRNVNGSIDLQDVAGSGDASTVNGKVKVTFRENPQRDSHFVNVNGAIELAFARGLSADFRFRNGNGGVYSDFALAPLPPRVPRTEQRDGKFVYRADAFTGGRAGAGGPEIAIENLNGDIRVLAR